MASPWLSVFEQPREKFSHIAWRIEMPVDSLRTPADGECEPIEIGHDGKHRFVGDVIADEHRASTSKRLVTHKFAHAGCLGEARMLDFAHQLTRQHLNRRVR